jgi:integrase
MTDAYLPPAGGVRFSQIAPAREVRYHAANARAFTVRELADAYMASYRGRDRSRAYNLAQWCALIGDKIAVEVDADCVADHLERFRCEPARRYLGRKRDTGEPRWKELGHRKAATLNRLKSALSALFAWAKDRRRRLLPATWPNPCRDIPAEREDNARVRFLCTEERDRLLKATRVSAWPRLHLLVLMALVTGARRGELLALRWRDVDLDVATALVGRGKNGEPRVLPLTELVVAELRRQAGRPHPDALVFARYDPAKPAQFSTAWRRAMTLAQIENFRFHDLRHSCASYLAQSGASLLEIADVLGHKQLDVTRRYAHLTVNTKRQLVQRVLGQIGGGG